VFNNDGFSSNQLINVLHSLSLAAISSIDFIVFQTNVAIHLNFASKT